MCLICDRIEMIGNGTNPYFVRELETGYVVIGDNQYFPGYVLFLCKQHKTELFYLEEDFCRKFLAEMTIVAEAASIAFHADKMNYELLGNEDSHLHWHLFSRKKGDLGDYSVNGAGGPVWYVPWSIMSDAKYKASGDMLEKMKADMSDALDEVLKKKGIS